MHCVQRAYWTQLAAHVVSYSSVKQNQNVLHEFVFTFLFKRDRRIAAIVESYVSLFFFFLHRSPSTDPQDTGVQRELQLADM